MGFRPPPLPKQIAHAVPILHMEFVLEEICHRGGSSAMVFLPGGRLAIIMVLYPWGSPAMVFLQGERLSYGIISAGTISHLLPYHEICVGGDLP